MKVDLSEVTNSVFRLQTNNICLKFREAAIIFTRKNADKVDETRVLKHTDALLFKFTIAVINLEFLWQISEQKNNKKGKVKETELFEWNNSASIIDSTFLESTIIQIRSFIDFAQKLSCITLGYNKPVDKTKDFYKILDKVDSKKSEQIKNNFSNVDESWGVVIRSIRDKIIHYDLIKTNHEFRPTLQGKNYEEFAQEMTNNMYDLLMDLCKTLFDIEWIPGTIKEFKKKYAR